MAIPDYFQRNAIAISQAISGLGHTQLESMLGHVCVGVTIGRDAQGREGRALADLLIRLLARLYPALMVRAEGDRALADEVVALAQRINPRVETSATPTMEVVVGCASGQQQSSRTVYAGSSGWTGRVSARDPQECGDSNNPFGPGVAACLAAASLFRSLFMPETETGADVELSIPDAIATLDGGADVAGDVGQLVLAGGGAIGNAAVWALARTEVTGSIDVVDHERIDLDGRP